MLNARTEVKKGMRYLDRLRCCQIHSLQVRDRSYALTRLEKTVVCPGAFREATLH